MTLATRQVLEAGVVLLSSLTVGLHQARAAYEAEGSSRLAMILGVEALIALAMWVGRAKWREQILQSCERSLQAALMRMQWCEDGGAAPVAGAVEPGADPVPRRQRLAAARAAV